MSHEKANREQPSKPYRWAMPLSTINLLLPMIAAYLVYQHLINREVAEPDCGIVLSASGQAELEGFKFSITDAWKPAGQEECQEAKRTMEAGAKELARGYGITTEPIIESFAAFRHADGHLLTGFISPSPDSLEAQLKETEKRMTFGATLGMKNRGISIEDFNGVRCIEANFENSSIAARNLTCKQTDTSPMALVISFISPLGSATTAIDTLVGSLVRSDSDGT